MVSDVLDIGEFTSPTAKDSADIKRSIDLYSVPISTYVMLVAVNRIFEFNKLTKISCDRGTPLGGYVYDMVNDCYWLSCEDYVALGYVPVSFQLRIKSSGHWGSSIPMPEEVLIRHMDEQQFDDLNRFKTLYGEEHFDLHFLQLLGSN